MPPISEHPRDCPGWEYEHHGSRADIAPRCARLLVSLRTGAIDVRASALDTRPFHRHMFEGLTPTGCPYFAGHYRGEDFRCLRHYGVMIHGDPEVGAAPERVAPDMSNFNHHILKAGFAALDKAFELPDSHLSAADKLYYLVVFACRCLVEFLRIHPYANGNGHQGRFIVWLILARYGYWPKKWPLNQSPPYGQLIYDHRRGNPGLLEQFVLQAIIG